MRATEFLASVFVAMMVSSPAFAEPRVRIALVGDSTVTEKQGWGLGFAELVAGDVELTNLARGGRSSKSYLDEGLWAECLKLKPDYVLIQFGHNDEPGKGLARETDAATTYRANMERYVDEARAAGIKPILVTSLCRRQFKSDGKIHSSLIPYVEVVKEIAVQKSVPLIDLHAASIEWFEKLGADNWHHLSKIKADGKWDATHLNPEGSRAVAPIVAVELRRAVPELSEFFMAAQVKETRVLQVAADGSGQFTTVQSAVDSIPDGSKDRVVISIKPGVYKERVQIGKKKPPISLRGEDRDAGKTVLTWNYTSKTPGEDGKEIGTSGSYSTLIESDDFQAENVTFENSYGDGVQAVALRTTGDRNAFYNCRFLGWQDTLYVHQGRDYFRDCYIEGRVDFIFGRSTAVFENCHIHSKNGGYVTASGSPPEQPFGLVFIKCKLTGEGAQAYLGRPWKTGAATAFIGCELGEHIYDQGWSIWKGNENHTSARYVEYKSTGPGAKPESRIEWSKQLSDDEAKQYTVDNVLGDWNP